MNRPPVPLRPDYGAMKRQHVASLARAGWAHAVAAIHGRAHSPDEIIAKAWPDDRTAFAIVTKAAVPPTTTASAPALGQTIASDFAAGLVGVSAGAELIALSPLQLTFGRNVAISVPSLSAPAGTIAFVAEGAPIPARELSSGRLLLEPKKLASISTLTREMVETAPVDGERMVAQVLREGASAALDAAIFSTAAETDAAAACLLYGITQWSRQPALQTRI
jgi:hypothetical protein